MLFSIYCYINDVIINIIIMTDIVGNGNASTFSSVGNCAAFDVVAVAFVYIGKWVLLVFIAGAA